VSVETRGLQRLLELTPITAPDYALLVSRLAAAYAELARGTSGRTAFEARRDAIKNYTLLMTLDNHQYLPEAYYYAGLENELAGHRADAQRLYDELIRRAPDSRFAPFAYFALGELSFTDDAADPLTIERAWEAYQTVLTYPSPSNVLRPDALLRLAEISDREGDVATSEALTERLQREFPTSAAATRWKSRSVNPEP
jgi:TolA-binding protein